MLQFINYDVLLLWLSFAFCLSLTTAGVLVLFRIEQVRRTVALQYLQYFLILLYVFGYYSLWSTILMSHFLDIENVERLTTILSQMGVPFFVICLMMQLLWAIKTQTNPSKLIFPAALSLSVVVVVIVLQSPWPIGDSVRAAYSLAGFVISIAVAGILLGGKNAVLPRKWVDRLSAVVVCSGLIHLTYFSPLVQSAYYETGFVFLFFLFNTALAVLFTYTATAPTNVGQSSESFADFVRRYGITNRETDIIEGIYAGKTNQEIADHLFINVQTVKDHSSRIYQKIHVKNRAQLSALLRDNNVVLP